MPDELRDVILEVAQGPARVVSDGQSVDAQPLRDLVAADEHLRGTDAADKKHRGLRFTTLLSPGTV